MSEYVLKRHNKTLLLYHIVCPTKYRRKVFTEGVENTLKKVWMGIGECFEIHFIEIGTDEDHFHFLIQSIPMFHTTIMQTIKSITAKEIVRIHPEKMLWGGKFWTSGYYIIP